MARIECRDGGSATLKGTAKTEMVVDRLRERRGRQSERAFLHDRLRGTVRSAANACFYQRRPKQKRITVAGRMIQKLLCKDQKDDREERTRGSLRTCPRGSVTLVAGS